jgi:hypothetical protein
MITIHPSQENRDKTPVMKHKAYLLKFADAKFWFVNFDNVENIHQDDYEIIHDIIADLFYEQLNGKNYAYTSSGSLAGHHNMDNSGTLIFNNGEPIYVFDRDSENEDDAEVQFSNNVENWEMEK